MLELFCNLKNPQYLEVSPDSPGISVYFRLFSNAVWPATEPASGSRSRNITIIMNTRKKSAMWGFLTSAYTRCIRNDEFPSLGTLQTQWKEMKSMSQKETQREVWINMKQGKHRGAEDLIKNTQSGDFVKIMRSITKANKSRQIFHQFSDTASQHKWSCFHEKVTTSSGRHRHLSKSSQQKVMQIKAWSHLEAPKIRHI